MKIVDRLTTEQPIDFGVRLTMYSASECYVHLIGYGGGISLIQNHCLIGKPS